MRIVAVLLAVGLAGLIAHASINGDFGVAGAWLTSDPWGIVTLADLYAGLALAAVIIAVFEGRVATALFWCLPLPVLGNLWTLVWFALRWPRLKERLSRRS